MDKICLEPQQIIIVEALIGDTLKALKENNNIKSMHKLSTITKATLNLCFKRKSLSKGEKRFKTSYQTYKSYGMVDNLTNSKN
jgi:hypothetical protein